MDRLPGVLRLLVRAAGAVILLLMSVMSPAGAQAVSGRLVVFNAGSLALPFRELLAAFRKAHPGVTVAQESAGSLESARKLTELGKIPDVLGTADWEVIPQLLIPSHATWYATFARNAMTLIYTDQSLGAGEIDGANWWRVLQRPGVRVGRSNPALDPNGYRVLMVFDLAEQHYGVPGLARQLLAASPSRFVRPKEADLTALVQAGELDYAWTYRSIAETAGLRMVRLPPEVDLSDPARAAAYGHVSVRLPGARLASSDSIEIRGQPIVYALTIPTRAANPDAARAFVRFVFSDAGRRILARTGLRPVARPDVGGPGQPPPDVLP